MSNDPWGHKTCPLCKLSPRKVIKMTKKQAEALLFSDSGKWCFDHLMKWMAVRAEVPMMGKRLLSVLVDRKLWAKALGH